MKLRHWLIRRAAWNEMNWKDDRAAQIAEFALSLPLLVVFVVGIFDFSSAVTLKQKLTNAAREGARIAAADPASDLASPPSSGVPSSVSDAFQVVDNYLNSENIGDCGLGGAKPALASGLKWVSTASTAPCGPTNALILTINRGCTSSQTVESTTVNMVATCVTIQYPYAWQYSKVAGLVGGTFVGPTSITTTATAYNEN
jgi:Flp pilus assembly protein TadG